MSQSWKGCSWQLGLASSLAIGGAIASSSVDCVFAQSVIIPDHTLGNESSRVLPNKFGGFTEVLTGGAIRGNNLFHSFLELNVTEGRSAFFLSPNSNIQNIVVRVTGSNLSKIDGILGTFQMSDGKITNSNANLFLINPNGIIFGPNAVVKLNGSFVVSTASSIKFTDGTLFSASAPKTTPLLTVSVPLGLQFGRIPGDIIVQGELEVPLGKTLVLVGGNVTLDGKSGILKGNSDPQDNQIGLGSQIALGGILGAGMIGLNLDSNSLPLSFPNGVQPADVSFSNDSQVYFSSEGGGSIQVQGRRVTLTDGSQLVAQTLGNLNGREIFIQAEQRTIKDGSQVRSSTFGAGFGGQLTVTASDSVQLSGTDAAGNPSGLFARTSGKRMAGNLTINTGKLIVQDGANISTTAEAGSQSPGGTLNVTASDFVKVSGTSAITGKSSILSTRTLGSGDAGSLTIDTNSLIVQDGGRVTSSANEGSQGNGGTLTVQAHGGSVELSGTGLNDKTTGLFAQTLGSGDAGSLVIDTGQLIVRDGAQVTVESSVTGTGTAGNLAVNARSIRLDNNALLTANTQSAKVVPNREQATININSRDLILRRGSNIKTNATGENVIGGNIKIDTDVLAAVEKSIISADSVDARGGRVFINTQGLFRSPDSKITATGANSQLNGTVQINTPDVDPSRGLIPLTVDVVDVARLVDDNICARTAKSSFTYTGRGGLPPSPNNTLNSDVVWEDWQLTTVPRGREGEGKSRRGAAKNSSRPTQIVAAQGWIMNQNGDVILTAYAPTATPHLVGSSSFGCQPPITK
ncbi:MAG: filamentous hemagglutinin N-terminal domain-containing protein [Rhizonema sp. PD38]|nr:filamentous hemagglutinin N-terminal domain-containing protein [Rhizonema sp. PD38]